MKWGTFHKSLSLNNHHHKMAFPHQVWHSDERRRSFAFSDNWLLLPSPLSCPAAWERLKMVGMWAGVIKCSHPLEHNTWQTLVLSAQQRANMWLVPLDLFSSSFEEKDLAHRNDVWRYLVLSSPPWWWISGENVLSVKRKSLSQFYHFYTFFILSFSTHFYTF